jgi:ribosomal protein S18 acetylase RimI-like enzyme
MTCIIREAEEKDACKVEELAKKCPPLRASVEGTYEYLALCFKRYFLLAECQGEIIGFVVGFPSLEGKMWIYQIAVNKEHRLRKIANRLLTEEIKRSQLDGYKTMGVRALKSNEASIELLKNFGFKETRIINNWIELEKSI